MFRRIIDKLLASAGLSRNRYGSGGYYGPKKYGYDSDDYNKTYKGVPPHHTQYGQGYYKKKKYSSS
jgi:hypothetical protein